MKYGPKTGGSYLARAQERWGRTLPEWVAVLAAAADNAASQSDLGRRLGVSPAAISAVIGNTYPGKRDRIEARVRGALMQAKVSCPILGPIGRQTCMDAQELPFSSANPMRAQLYGACRKPCPHYLGGKK